jgi:hypothetical protein
MIKRTKIIRAADTAVIAIGNKQHGSKNYVAGINFDYFLTIFSGSYYLVMWYFFQPVGL